MSNEILRETLNELLGKVTEKLQSSGAALWKSEEAVECARSNLEDAKSQESQAINEDEYLRKKIKALMDHYNGLTAKPDVLREEINNLNAQQSKTFNKSRDANMRVEDRKRDLSRDESNLRMVHDHHKKIEKEW